MLSPGEEISRPTPHPPELHCLGSTLGVLGWPSCQPGASPAHPAPNLERSPRDPQLHLEMHRPQEPVCMRAKSLQSCPTLCDPMDHSPPGSSVHGILQVRILQGVAVPSFRGPSRPRDRTRISCVAGRFFSTELLGKAPPPQEPALTFFKQRFCHTPHIRSQYTAGVLATRTSKSCKTHRKVFFRFQPAGGPPLGGGFRGDSARLSFAPGTLVGGACCPNPLRCSKVSVQPLCPHSPEFSLPPRHSVGHSDTVSSLLYPLRTEFVPGQFCRRPCAPTSAPALRESLSPSSDSDSLFICVQTFLDFFFFFVQMLMFFTSKSCNFQK